MTTHTVEPTSQTLHGAFRRDWPPILTIEPGDTVGFRTLDAGWGIEGPEVPRKHFEPRDPDRGDGAGRVATRPPRLEGGTSGCKALVAGSVRLLPIAVSAGTSTVGGSDTVQGAGEIAAVATGCPLHRVELIFQLDVRPPIQRP